MTWTCDQIEARLSDYLEGLLPAPEGGQFEAHAKDCPQCAPLVESVRNLISEMQSAEQLQVPARLVDRILERTLGPRERLTFGQKVRSFVAGLGTARFAYGFASVAATLFILFSASGISWRKPKLGDLNPSTMSQNISRQYHLQKARAVKYVSDLRVVYEIQSRLRQDENQLQAVPQENTPKSENQEKRDDHTRTQPKQQNRADDLLARQLQMLAAACPSTFERSYR